MRIVGLGRAASALAATLALAGCTGTQEVRTPVALVVAANDASGGFVDLYASNLPPRSGSSGGGPELLASFRRTLDGDVVDVAVARGDPARLYVLHRDDRDLLSVFDVSELSLADPSTLPAGPAPLDLDAIVANAAVLPPGELCSSGLTVSDDGRWAGLVHAPGCDPQQASNVLLVELEPPVGASRRVRPDTLATDDAPGSPAVVRLSGVPHLVWPGREGRIVGLSLDEPDAPTVNVATEVAELSAVLDLGLGGRGLTMVDQDRLVSVRPSDGEASRVWRAPSGVSFVAVVDALALPGAPALVLGDDRLLVYPDVDAEDDVEPGEGSVPAAIDAVVDPYGYALVAGPGALIAFDLLDYLADADGDLPRVPSVGFEAGERPVAVEWLFAPVGAP